MNICGVGCFFGVVGIGLVAGFTLRAVASFTGELEFWFLCGAVLSISTLVNSPIFTLIGLNV